MLTVTDGYKNKIYSNEREFLIKVTFDNSEDNVLTGDEVQTISFEEVVNSADELILGSSCSNKISMSIIDAPPTIDYANLYFDIEIGLKNVLNEGISSTEWIALGRFYPIEVTSDNDFKTVKIIAYDGFSKMNDKYIAENENITTLQELYDDFKSQLNTKCKITLKEETLTNYVINYKNLDVTYTQMAGIIAGCLGGFARFNRKGILEICKYEETDLLISNELIYMDGFVRNTKDKVVIKGITSGTNENPIVKGDGASGYIITYTNDLITSEMVSDIYNEVKDLEYVPCEIKWLGDLALQAGDIINVEDNKDDVHSVVVMNHTLEIGGGINDTIHCYGKSENESALSNNYSSASEKFKRIYSTMEDAILNATKVITGNSGGYVILKDSNEDGKPDEILISDSEDIESANIWRWNKEGLGFSSNGYNGPYAQAMTSDGKIVADMITTGTLNAERIAVETYDNSKNVLTDYINFNNGTITIGKNVIGEDGEAKQILKLVETAEELKFVKGDGINEDIPLAKMTGNSLEIGTEENNFTSLRLGNFGFFPRSNGNLSFKKVGNIENNTEIEIMQEEETNGNN